MQNALTVIKIGSIVALRGAGPVRAGEGRAGPLRTGGPTIPGGLLAAFGVAMIAALWTYDGWYGLTCSAGEMRDPGTQPAPRADPRHGGGDAALPAAEPRLRPRPGPAAPWRRRRASRETAAAVLFGPGAARLVSLAVLISTFGCLSSTILYSSRIYLPMAEDGLFFRSLARVDPRLPHAGRLPLGADRLGAGAHRLGQLLAALHLRDLRQRRFPRHDRRRRLHPPAPPAGPPPPLPDLGLPGGAGPVHPRLPAADREHPEGEPGGIPPRPRPGGSGVAGIWMFRRRKAASGVP